ncbi:MAG TPA: O-antigen ligase family protein [Candidatus Saccharimonadales bacterium]|nr:O-antigen ligase family protein [Candidatus Saccharimonadales bacterium]
MLSATERAALAESARPAARLAFAALIVLSPFRARIELLARPAPPIYGDFTDFLVFWSDIALVATIGLWLLSLLARPRPVSFGPRFLSWPVGGLLLVAWLSVPFSVDVGISAYSAIRLVVLAVLAVYVVNEVDGLDLLLVPVSVMVVVQAIVAIGEVVSQHSLGLAGLGEYNLAPSLGVSVVTAADGTRYLRGYGLTDHPNILGGVLAFALIILIGSARSGRPERTAALRAAVFGLGAVALLMTFSRGAWLGLGIGLAVVALVLFLSRDRTSLQSLGVAVLAGALLCAPFIAPYLPALASRTGASGPVATETRSIDEREAVAEVANRLFIGHFLVGVGLGAIPVAMQAAEPAFPYAYQPASIVLLDVAAETGLFGALLYLLILIWPWVALVRHRRRWTSELATASGALAAVTVVGFFDYYTWTYSAGRIWAWLVLGLWAVAYRNAITGRTDAA